MILKFSIIIGLFLFFLPACDRKPEPVEPPVEPVVPIISLSEVDETDPDLKPGGPPVHRPLEEEDASQTNTDVKKPKPVQTAAGGETVAASTAAGGDGADGETVAASTAAGGDGADGETVAASTAAGGDGADGETVAASTAAGGDGADGETVAASTAAGGDGADGETVAASTAAGGDGAGGETAAASTAAGGDGAGGETAAPVFIPGDSIGGVFNDDTSPPPMELKFTAKQLVDSGLLGEGGSDIYHSYMTIIINNIHNLLIQSKSEEDIAPLSFLCDGDIPLCRKEGLSLDRLNAKKIMNIINVAGTFFTTDIYPIDQGEALLVLQGPEITQESVKDVMENVEKNGYVIKKVLINLPQQWGNMELFFYLASQVKEKQMDLYIVGQCGFPCANHLVPAARTVITAYYGNIGYIGNMSSVYEDVKKAYPPRLEQLINQFRQDYFSQGAVNGLVKLFTEHVENPMTGSLYNQSPIRKPLEQANQTFSPQPAFSFWGLSPENQRIVLSQVTQEIQLALITFFFNVSESVQNSAGYHSYNQQMAKAEMDHYEEFQILPESNMDYSYSDFVTLTGRLVRNLRYMTAFPSSRRSYYSDPEEKKPYVAVFPSTELLEALGIPIQGKNPTELLHSLLSEDSKARFLFLSLEDMENCDFFAPSASFTTETLQACLSEDGSL